MRCPRRSCGLFAGVIGAVWGLAVLRRTNAKGVPKLADAALLAETFANEIVPAMQWPGRF